RNPSRMLRISSLRSAEALDEHDMTRADHVAAAAFDAIVEPERLEIVEISCDGRDDELLRLQARRARRRAFAAADACPLLVIDADLVLGRREDAAGRFRDRQRVARERVAHHAAAVDQPRNVVAIPAALLDQPADRRADRRFDVARALDAEAGHGHDSGRDRLAAERETLQCKRGPYVLA